MCTIAAKKLHQGIFVFKNRDPIRGTPLVEEVSRINVNNVEMIIIQNSAGQFGGINYDGTAIVGTFVNIHEHQKNYFNENYLSYMLSLGEINNIVNYLKLNPDKLYGNLIVANSETIYAFELSKEEIWYKEIDIEYTATNHFINLSQTLRTIDNSYIVNWTTKRKHTAEQLISNVQSLNDIKNFLRNHAEHPYYSICNHGDIPTASSYIFDCAKKLVYYCSGAPCLNEYKKIGF